MSNDLSMSPIGAMYSEKSIGRELLLCVTLYLRVRLVD